MRLSVKAYAVTSGSMAKYRLPAEEIALASIAHEASDKTILDLGVGAGRTVKALTQISSKYVGLDYTLEMVNECKERFPGVSFVHGDARDLGSFESNSIFLAVFSCSGLSMVDHAGRIKILQEVFRVLKPGGYFLFSTGNRDRAKHKKFFRLPELSFSWHPVRMLKNGIRFFVDTTIGFVNRLKFKKFENECNEYAVVNDVYHNYSTLIYYITQTVQQKQLLDEGFESPAKVFDSLGIVVNKSDDNDLTFLARKPL